MLKIVISFVFVISTLSANSSLESIYTNIILKNSLNSITVADRLEESINKNRFNKAKKQFSDFVIAYKNVEAFYILGDLDDNYLDSLRYIDIFHQGNEDIKEQLALIIEQKNDLSISLYKNSYKTINALEYILFTQDLTNPRVKNIAMIIVNKIEENLKFIYNGYMESKNLFVENEQKANAIMLNSLIENSYKLKEWRVGDPSGLSRKFRDKPKNSRAEYYISKNSLKAIQAIIDTHLLVLDKQKFDNFGTMIKSYDVEKELKDSIQYLKDAQSNTKDIQNDNFLNAKKLYKSLKKLHTAYYISLIGKLKITSKILDADGD